MRSAVTVVRALHDGLLHGQVQVGPLAAIPTPTAVQPPGTEGLLTVLNWVTWIVTAACVFGVLVVAGMMAVSHRRGQGSEAVGNLGWVMGGCVLAASASQLVNVLI
jgi:hypothetical protein